MIRTVLVQVVVDATPIGSGILEYEDKSMPMLFDAVEYKCATADLYIDNVKYEGAIWFCYEDKVAYQFGGVDSKTIKIPVYMDSDVVGEAEIPFVDSYSFTIFSMLSIIMSLVATASAILTIALLPRVAKK